MDQPLVGDPRPGPPAQPGRGSRPAAWRSAGCRPRGGPGGSPRHRAGGGRRRCRGRESSDSSPTPESCSSCGVLIAPPQRITSPASTRAAQPAAAQVVDADRALALEADPGGHRQGLDGEVRPAADRVQVGAGGGEAAAAVDVAVEPRETLLPVAVDVVGQRGGRPAARPRRTPPNNGFVGRSALEHQRAVAAAPVVGADGAVREQAGLHPLEVGQAVGEVPLLHPRLGGPALVVQRVAALEDHPVDARRAAEHLAAGVEDLAVVQVRLGVGVVAPVVEAAADRERQRGRHVDERVELPVRVAGLEDQDAGAAVGGEPVRQGAPGRATAHDDDVVPVLGHQLPNHFCSLGRMLCQTCLVSRYSSRPAWPSSRPMPDCL